MIKAKEKLAEKYGVDPAYLHYIGYTDCSFRGEGCELYQYNIIDVNHKMYKSTVAIKSWEM